MNDLCSHLCRYRSEWRTNNGKKTHKDKQDTPTNNAYTNDDIQGQQNERTQNSIVCQLHNKGS